MAHVYAIVVDGIVRYIGKGTGKRASAHMKMVRSIARRRAAGETVKATLFYNRLTKAWLAGCTIDISIIADGLTDQAAFDREIIEIEKTTGLWNEAPGGYGFNADQWRDDAFRQKMAKREERKRTPEYRAWRSEFTKGRWFDREAMTKLVWNDERRLKMRLVRVKRQHEMQIRKLAFQTSVLERRLERQTNKRGYHANAGSFSSERSRIVQLQSWRENKSMRLAALGRRSNGQWKGGAS